MMPRNSFLHKKAIFLITIIGFLLSSIVLAVETPEELKRAIEDKTQALTEINQKIAQTQKDLDETEVKGASLQKEVKKADYTISQLNLNIKSSEVNIQKLTLEIEALKYDISDTESRIDVKKLAIADLLRELQKKDGDTVLTTLLKNKSLAESLDEVQSIIDINSGLSVQVEELVGLNDQLSDKLDERSTKKTGVELENKNLKNRQKIIQTEKSNKQTLLTQTKNQEKTFQQLLVQLQKEQDALEKELNDIEAKLRESFDPNLLPAKRPGVFAWPAKLKKDGGIGVLTQGYGQTPYSSALYKKTKIHNGYDIGLPIGTPIFAAESGKVIAVDNNDRSSWQKYQYGKYTMIEHSNNFTTLYAHLSVSVVKKGDVVQRGDLIGYSGNTGYSTGPHIHFGIYWTPSLIFKELPPARGFVPIGITADPGDYL